MIFILFWGNNRAFLTYTLRSYYLSSQKSPLRTYELREVLLERLFNAGHDLKLYTLMFAHLNVLAPQLVLRSSVTRPSLDCTLCPGDNVTDLVIR